MLGGRKNEGEATINLSKSLTSWHMPANSKINVFNLLAACLNRARPMMCVSIGEKYEEKTCVFHYFLHSNVNFCPIVKKSIPN